MAQLSFWDQPEECDPGDQNDFTDILARSTQQYDPRFEYGGDKPEWVDPCQRKRWLALRKRLLKDQGYLCYYCKIKIDPGHMHIDHKQPVSRQGSHLYSNLCATCRTCNLRKSDLTEMEFRGEVQRNVEQVVSVSEYRPGQRVRHSQFGKGIIILVKSIVDDDTEVDVKFDGIKQVKRLSSKIANLEVIEKV